MLAPPATDEWPESDRWPPAPGPIYLDARPRPHAARPPGKRYRTLASPEPATPRPDRPAHPQPRRSHGRMPPVATGQAAVRAGNQTSGALQDGNSCVFFAQRLSGGRTIRLYVRSGDSQQTCGLPGCGVITLFGGKLKPPFANRLSASASHTWGRGALAAADNRLRPQAACPRPGPATMIEACSSKPISWLAESVPRAMTSGTRARAAATCSLRVARDTIPAPLRKALSAQSRAAPPKPRSPPISNRCPNWPLWALGERAASRGNVPGVSS